MIIQGSYTWRGGSNCQRWENTKSSFATQSSRSSWSSWIVYREEI